MRISIKDAEQALQTACERAGIPCGPATPGGLFIRNRDARVGGYEIQQTNPATGRGRSTIGINGTAREICARLSMIDDLRAYVVSHSSYRAQLLTIALWIDARGTATDRALALLRLILESDDSDRPRSAEWATLEDAERENAARPPATLDTSPAE